MRVLLDTCVLSELRLSQGHPGVRRAVEGFDSDNLFISVISTGEIAKGIALLKESKKRRDLETWLQTLERFYADRILSIDLETAHIWGELTAGAQRLGKIIPASDGLLAATAQRHGLHIMTRNIEHFVPTNALLLNPWTDSET